MGSFITMRFREPNAGDFSAMSFSRKSGLPYLFMISVGALAARWSPYFLREDWSFKGQPAYVLIPYVAVFFSLILFMIYRAQEKLGKNTKLLLVVVMGYWIIQFALKIFHGDEFDYTAFIVPLVVFMIWFKPPSSNQAWQLVVSIGLILLFILIASYLLELAGLTSRMPTPPGLNAFESGNYWLPLDGFLGVDGRWVGPFGHNTRGAMAATFIAVIGFAKINRASWVLIPGGFYFLLVFGVRAGFLSTFVGLLLVGLFSNNKLANRIPAWLKLGTVAFGTLFTAFAFSMSGAGTTGRAAIWPAFWNLIPEGAGALVGVGQLGIAEGSELTRVSMDAHNIFLDALVRNGILGLVCLIVSIGLILSQSMRVAFMRLPGPIAVVSAYLVASMTDIQNDLFHSSYQLLLVLSASITAALILDEKKFNHRISPSP